MKTFSILAVVAALACHLIPNIWPVEEEVDYYVVGAIWLGVGILARIDSRLGKMIE